MTIERPQGGPPTGDAFVGREGPFGQGQHLQTLAPLPIPRMMEQRPERATAVLRAIATVALRQVDPQVEHAAGLFAIEVLGQQPLVGVKGPQHEFTLLLGIGGPAPERPDPASVFSGTIGPPDEGPRRAPFLKLALPIDRMGEEGPQECGVVASLGALCGEQRQRHGVGDRILGANALAIGDPKGPDDKTLLVAGHNFGQVAQGIGPHQRRTMLLAIDWPHLPTLGGSGAHVDERREIIVGDHVALAGLDPEWQRSKAHLVAKQSAFKMAVERHQRPVRLGRVVRALAEPEREQGEAPLVRAHSALPSTPAHELNDVEAVLRTVLIEGHQRVKELGLRALDARFVLVGHPRRETPAPRLRRLLPMEERPQRFPTMPGAQRQRKLLGQRPEPHLGVWPGRGGQPRQPR